MRKIAIIVFLWLGCQVSEAQLVINELMQSNVDCIMDDLNDFPDSWVELYNPTTQGINLWDYRLGISENSDEAWQLPYTMIGGGQYVLICCDKESQGLHTPFRLESGKGGAVYLFRGNDIVDQVKDLPKQPAPNIAYGRKTDGGEEWGYQLEPTPKASNCGRTSDKILGDPVFSEQGRVMTDDGSLTLTLSLPEGAPEGTEIRMTTDGSEPMAGSTKYTGPLSISSTTIIRARLFCDGWLSPRSVTQSYIFFPRQQTLPVVSIVTNNRYLTDSKIGIYVDGNYQSNKKNYEFNWRRPMNIELFETSGQQSVINQLCEGRVAGGATRSAMLKTLAVYAHKRFGTKHFKYEFFPDQKPGIKEFKSIMLRNAGNDFDYLYMRDAIIQRTMASHVDLDWQAWRPAIIYMNGVYKGILNIRERSNEDNIWSNYDKLEDIDMVENWKELKAGDKDAFNVFFAYCKGKGQTMADFEKWMDCSEYADVMLMNLYYNNLDTPGNNWVMWKPRTEDGRWRFVVKDVDYAMGLYGESYQYKILNWLYNPNYDYGHNWGANSSDATRIFRRLMEDPEFFTMFIDRACIYMGDFMNERGTRKLWDPMFDVIKLEYPYHRKLINEWWPNYYDEMGKAQAWLSQRTNMFYQHIGDYYKLGKPITMTVNKSVEESVETSFNGIRLSEGFFDGKFFPNRQVTLTCKAPEGKAVSGWNVQTVSTTGSVSQTFVEGETCAFTMPECSSMVINAVMGVGSGIDSVSEPQWTWQKDGNRLILCGVPAGTRVQLYDLRGIQLQAVDADGSVIILPLAPGQLHLLKVGPKTIKL